MPKQKRGFLLFICSLIPGAGEMYLGFFKQGISIMTLFWVQRNFEYVVYSLALQAPELQGDLQYPLAAGKDGMAASSAPVSFFLPVPPAASGKTLLFR